MIDSAKESHQVEIPVVHWLNAINPDLFTEQAVRYVKTPIIPPISQHTVDTHMHIHTETCVHALSSMLNHLTHTSTHCIENHMSVCVKLHSYTYSMYA